MKNMIVNVLAISVAVGVVGVCQASKLEAAKGILKFSKESLSVAADLKEVFGGDGGDDNSGSGGKKGSNSIVFSVAQAAELNGVRFVDSLAEINTVAVKDTTVFVMIADQVAVINGAEVNDSSLHVNQIDLNDNLIGFLGVDQKFTATTLNISEGSTLAANQVFIDGSNLGFADITQMVSAYNLTLENSQMCLNCISVQ